MAKRKKKNIILSVGPTSATLLDAIKKSGNKKGDLRCASIYNPKTLTEKQKLEIETLKIIKIPCNLKSPDSIIKALKPYEDEFLAIICRAETRIPDFQHIIPHVPYLRTPTKESLDWSINKILMRRRFSAYNKKITPKFMVVKDARKKTLEEIEQKVGLPLVVKPSGLAQSILVNVAYHHEELEKILRRVFRHIRTAYKEYDRHSEPQVLVEQYMDGDMYSIDAYVNSRGKVYFCPMVAVKTGKQIGFDDFFGYQQMTPTLLTNESIKQAELVSSDAIHALGLRSSSAHIELMKTEKGWKVIELGPRLGGFRHKMYQLSYGINHAKNDILIRIPRKPIIPKRVLGYSATLKIFAKKEGIIKNLTGIKRVQTLTSFHSIEIKKRVGDKARFAKNGGKSIFNITFFNKNRSKLLADIRRLEQLVKIEVE